MDTKEQIAIMQAFVNGEDIECKHKNRWPWMPAPAPAWDWFLFEYRVASKRPEYRLFQYNNPGAPSDGYVVALTHNHKYNTNNEGYENHVLTNFGKWLTDWLPLPTGE